VTGSDLISLLPLLIVAAGSILVMLAIAIRRMYRVTVVLTFLTLAGALIADVLVPGSGRIGVLVTTGGLSQFGIGLVLVANLVVVLIASGYLAGYVENREEYYLLLLLETLGAGFLIAAVHFVSFLLGLELLSISLYALLAYVRTSHLANEAGIKYFILTAAASAVLLFGLSLVYFDLGTMSVADVSAALTAPGTLTPLLGAGIALTVAGIAFKLGLVPFHMWVADVYEGSPLPSTASIATVSKIAVFVFLYRLFGDVVYQAAPSVRSAFVVLAVASMLGGNWLALLQRNIKRILAYSSTANFGYLLLALVAGGAGGLQAGVFYLTVYAFTILGLFAVLTLISGPGEEHVDLDDVRGFAHAHPLLSASFVIMLLSLAGVPVTGGFLGKIYLFKAGVDAALWMLSAVFIAGSSIALFYYLRIVAVQVEGPEQESETGSHSGGELTARRSAGAAIAVGLLVLVVVVLGAYPAPLLSLLQAVGIG